MAAFEGLGRLGDRLGPGYRDLLQGTAGMAALLAGPKVGKHGGNKPNPATLRAVKRMPAEFQAEYAAAKAAGWKKPNGETWWPPNDGAVGTPVKTNLPPDSPLDRFGSENGSYLSPKGEAFENRAMPGVPENPPNNYIVKQSLPVEKAEIAPWFDQPGGGTQYKLSPPEGWNAEIDGPFNVAAAKRFGYLGDE